ncbi:MAG: hypothetical protein NVS1B6_13060 [Steroidobacteraceae bacterium]
MHKVQGHRSADRGHRRDRQSGGHRCGPLGALGCQVEGREGIRTANGDGPRRRQQSGRGFGHQAKVTPEDNETSQSLKKGGDDNLAALKKLKGASFDRAYVDREVTYHQAVLDAIDKTLLPNAKNAELKALLEKSRPAFVAHLEHARHLQASLGKTGG